MTLASHTSSHAINTCLSHGLFGAMAFAFDFAV